MAIFVDQESTYLLPLKFATFLQVDVFQLFHPCVLNIVCADLRIVSAGK